MTDINKDLRPISLTSTLCKIAEDAIIKYDLKPKIMARLDCNQFGFIPGSNTSFENRHLVFSIFKKKQENKGVGDISSLFQRHCQTNDLTPTEIHNVT